MTPRHICAFALFALTFAVPAAAQVPDPNNPYIESISYGGTGCPQGSVGFSVASDRLSFTLIFDRFLVVSAPGVAVSARRANCDIQVNLAIPPGSGESCIVVDHRGYVQLASEMGGKAEAKYDFQSKGSGRTRIGKGSDEFLGPVAKDYVRRDASTLGWSEHASSVEALMIGATLSVADVGPSQLTTDSIDWKLLLGACEPPPNH